MRVLSPATGSCMLYIKQHMGLGQVLGVSKCVLDATLVTLTILYSEVCASLEDLNNGSHQLSS